METTKLYVGNLSYSVTESNLSELFSEHGNVKSAKVIIDMDSGLSKGFAFVEMSDQAECQKAIDALNGKDFEGRALKVNESKPKPEGRDRNRGGGGYNNRY